MPIELKVLKALSYVALSPRPKHRLISELAMAVDRANFFIANVLVSSGLLNESHEGNIILYSVTPKGFQFVQKYEELMNFITSQTQFASDELMACDNSGLSLEYASGIEVQ